MQMGYVCTCICLSVYSLAIPGDGDLDRSVLGCVSFGGFSFSGFEYVLYGPLVVL